MLKKEIERWKEEVKVQEAKSSLSSGRLKSEVDAHKDTREKLDKLVKNSPTLLQGKSLLSGSSCLPITCFLMFALVVDV